MVRVRRSVVGMAPDDPALTWYRAAVQAMLAKPADDPRSWRYQGAVHGVPGGVATPASARGFWDQCNHQNWFFLPWHRAYLAVFEAIVASVIEDLGGPADWALPFWDYSARAGGVPDPRLMHAAFLGRALPNGQPNALWSRRAAVPNGDFNLTDDVVSLGALKFDNFTSARIGVPSGFGGPDSMANPGPDNGGLEGVPHNLIHTRVGGRDGFMSFPDTAALDPIFWLHHANIDRLWEVWRNRAGVSGSPQDPRWMSTVDFRFKGANGATLTLKSRDVLDTTALLHGYSYDGVPVAHEPAAGGVGVMGVGGQDDEPQPMLLGANAGPLELGDQTRTEVAIDAGIVPFGVTAGAKTYLSLENVTGAGNPGDYDVYVDLPGDGREPIRVGKLTVFGLERASDPDRMHGGGGLNQAFDITDAAATLGLRPQDAGRLAVTFRRDAPAPSDDGVPEALADYAPRRAAAPSIKVGRVSLYQA